MFCFLFAPDFLSRVRHAALASCDGARGPVRAAAGVLGEGVGTGNHLSLKQMKSVGTCVHVQDESRPALEPAGEPGPGPAPLSSSPGSLLPAPPCAPTALPAGSPEADGRAADENGDVEPMRNGAGHVSETESSDSGATPGDKDTPTAASQDMEGWP